MPFQLGKTILLGRKEARTNQDMITYFPQNIKPHVVPLGFSLFVFVLLTSLNDLILYLVSS